MLEVHSTKAFVNLACAHAQWFDKNEDGTTGNCASLHGYDRTVKLTFSGTVDKHGWLVPFGKLKEVKSWLEYYFDHTTVLPADDPRLGNKGNEKLDGMDIKFETGGLLDTLRILPYGVSMEMSSLFIWEHLTPYIKHITGGRAYISCVESVEHERNSAMVTASFSAAHNHSRAYFNNWKANMMNEVQWEDYLLPKKETWSWVSPEAIINRINLR